MVVLRIENSYVKGGEAFAAGVARDACPYPESSPDRPEWLDGWDDAERHDVANRDQPTG